MASRESSRRIAGEIEDLYPLSPAQAGMFFHCLNTAWQGMYGQQFVCTIRGALQPEAFERAWRQTIHRHPALRAVFVWEGLAQPLQAVVRGPEMPWTSEDWRAASRDQQNRTWDTRLRVDRSTGYALDHAPLMRFHLAHVADEEHWFLWSHHHLLVDGWGVAIVLTDVVRAYLDAVSGVTPSLREVPPYREYIRWLDRAYPKDAEAYWRRVLEGVREATPLPASAPALAMPAGADAELYAEERLTLDETVSLELQRWSARERITLNTLALGTWALLLSRHARQDDVVCGVTASGRPADLPGVDSMVGLFINTLPTRIRIPRGGPVRRWLEALQLAQADARQYEHTPLIDVQGWSDLPRRAPLFETVFVCENYPPPPTDGDIAGLRIEHADSFEPTHYALTMTVKPGRRIGLQIGYDRRRFEGAAVHRLLEQYARVMVGMAADPSRPLDRVSLLDDDERRQRVVAWNQTTQSIGDAWLDERVVAQTRTDPDVAAVEDEGRCVSYAELDAQTNRLARRLQEMGVGRDVVVAVCLEPSIALIVTLLAVVKSGGAYLPLDPGDPAGRLASVIEDSRAAVVVTDDAGLDRLPHVWVPVLDIDADADLIAAEDAAPIVAVHHGEDLAYVIYTSGSTGRPKGVMVTHAGLRNYVAWAAPYYGVTRGQRAPLHTSVSFDLAVTSLWVPLVSGGTVVICRGAAGAGLVAALRTERTGLLKLTPAHLALLEHGESHRGAAVAVVGGDALSGAAVQAWRRQAGPEARIYNEYGPTETVVGCSVFDASDWDGGAVPIGRPIANTQLYVLDRRLDPVPAGATGELYIGGPGVARGYLGQPGLTAACFVPDPFRRGRLYRTGDLARHRDDGIVEYGGRADRQVKIRGHRVELGEIDAVLCEHGAVEQAVVVRGASGGDRLIAYVVGRAGQPLDPTTLRAHMQQRVPEYMVPATWVVLDTLPLTSNGKIDRARLPDPEVPVAVPREPPRTAIEGQLVAIWREVLKVDEVGIHDNFFDLGGHSLIMVTLLSQIRAVLNQTVSMTDLFEYPTIGAFATFIANGRGAVASGVNDVPVEPDRSGVQALFAARHG